MNIEFNSDEEEEDPIEEYDGLNVNFAYFVVILQLPLLMRGHSIKVSKFERKVKVEVPSLYKLGLNLPLEYDASSGLAYFDLKKRVLSLILPVVGRSLDSVGTD